MLQQLAIVVRINISEYYKHRLRILILFIIHISKSIVIVNFVVIVIFIVIVTKNILSKRYIAFYFIYVFNV